MIRLPGRALALAPAQWTAALSAATLCAAALSAPALAADEPEFGVLHVAEGVETTYYTCTACHSEMIIAQQGLPRDRWDALLDWMVEEQGMSEPDPETRAEILDYLSEHYNTDRPHFPR